MAVIRNPSKMNLLILTSSFPRHKKDLAGLFVAELAETMEVYGYRIDVLAPASAIDRKDNNDFPFNVKRFRYFWPVRLQNLAYGDGIPENLMKNPLKILLLPFFFIFFLMNAFIMALKTDIIHSHWIIPSGLIGVILKKILRKRLIITVHSSDLHLLCHLPLSGHIAAYIMKNADRIIVLSMKQKEILLNLALTSQSVNEKIEISPMGVKNTIVSEDDVCEKLKREIAPGGEKILLFSGRIVPVKGICNLLQAVRNLHGFKTIIMGDGSEKKTLEEFVKHMSLDVSFVGVKSGAEKFRYIDIADLVVFPSVILKNGRTEGIPVALIEAMSRGKAVIASDVGGINEIITNMDNGILIKPEDIKTLSLKIKELLNDQSLTAKLGAEAKKTAEKYSLLRVGELYNDAYKGKIRTNINGVKTCGTTLV